LAGARRESVTASIRTPIELDPMVIGEQRAEMVSPLARERARSTTRPERTHSFACSHSIA